MVQIKVKLLCFSHHAWMIWFLPLCLSLPPPNTLHFTRFHNHQWLASVLDQSLHMLFKDLRCTFLSSSPSVLQCTLCPSLTTLSFRHIHRAFCQYGFLPCSSLILLGSASAPRPFWELPGDYSYHTPSLKEASASATSSGNDSRFRLPCIFKVVYWIVNILFSSNRFQAPWDQWRTPFHFCSLLQVPLK